MTLAGDMEPAVLLPISILREGNLTFDEFVHADEPLPFWFRHRNGHVVSAYPIIPGLLNVPAFALAHIHFLPRDIVKDRHALSMITTVFIAAGAVVLFYFCLLQVVRRKEAVIFFTLTYAFATNVWSTASRGLWQHGPSLLFLNGALLILFAKKERWFPLAGILTGLLVWNRPTNIVFALAISMFVLWKYPKRALKFFAPAACVAFLFFIYSMEYQGSLLAFGQGQPYAWFNGSILNNIPALLISPGRGLFIYTPLFLLAFPACWILIQRFRDETETLILLLTLALIPFFFIYGKWGTWWGGNVFGYRIITEVCTPLMLLIVLLWRFPKRSSKVLNIILGCTLFWSFAVQYIGVVRYPLCETGPEKRAQYDHPERFWNIGEAQLVRCIERFYSSKDSYQQAVFPAWTIQEERKQLQSADLPELQ
jgi:hypothetical protein